MKLQSLVFPAAVALAIAASTPALAATATGNMTVQMTITAECSVNAGGDSLLVFPSTGLLNTAVDGQTAATGVGSIQVQCTSGTTYDIGLSEGLNAAGGGVSARKMILSSNTIPYQLYSNAGRTVVWGNTVGTDTVAGTGTGAIQEYQVWGRVPAMATTPPPGTYTDTVTVTITY